MKNILPIFVIVTIALTGCESSRYAKSDPLWTVNELTYKYDVLKMEDGNPNSGLIETVKTRLITYDANIDLTIKVSTDSIKTVLNSIAKAN